MGSIDHSWGASIIGNINYGEHRLWGASIMGSIDHSWGASIMGSIDCGEH